MTPHAVDETGVYYPTGDGKPMAETDTHRNLMVELIATLKGFFAGRDAYVSGNLLVYYERGNPRKVLSPDCFVALGLRQVDRPLFKTWDEGKFPDVVFELTSSSTAREDQRKKLTIYRDVWQVQEYFLFDPLGDYLTPPLQGHRLEAGQFVRIEPVGGRLPSAVLGIQLEAHADELLVYDAATGRRRYSPDEERAIAAEAEVARLRAELAALRPPQS